MKIEDVLLEMRMNPWSKPQQWAEVIEKELERLQREIEQLKNSQKVT